MAGWGRNVKALWKTAKPKSISIIDINPDWIKKAEQLFQEDLNVLPYCEDLNDWIQHHDLKYRLVVGVWTLSYMDE